SSLKYLQRFPVDIIKIDKSFIQDLSAGRPESRALISSIITMTNAFQMSVIAEGVETEEQLIELRKLHCQEVQGYYFSKPVSPEQFEVFILNRPIDREESLPDRRTNRTLSKEDMVQEHNESIMRHAIEQTKVTYALSSREVE